MAIIICAECSGVWCTCNATRCPNCGRGRIKPKTPSPTSLTRLPWIKQLREQGGAPPLEPAVTPPDVQ